jgi:hypothetical protein
MSYATRSPGTPGIAAMANGAGSPTPESVLTCVLREEAP